MANVILLQKGDLKQSDFTNDNSNNKQGIGIRLSSDKGNLLQQRKNGLYYGIEAPPDTANLYVSSTMGDDGNTGTRTSPLKTIVEAARRNSIGTKFTIYLYETDVHEWRGSWGPVFTGKLFTVRPYGPVADDVQRRNPRGTLQWLRSRELIRPTVRFKYDGSVMLGNTDHEFNKMSYIASPVTGTYTLYGIVLDYTDTEGKDLALTSAQLTTFGYHTSACNITAYGCDFILDNHAGLFTVGASCDITLDACNLNYERGNFLGEVMNSGFVNLTVTGTSNVDGREVTGTPAGQTPLTLRATSASTEFGRLIRGISQATVAKNNVLSQNRLF